MGRDAVLRAALARVVERSGVRRLGRRLGGVPVAAAPAGGLTARFMRETWGDSVAHLSDEQIEAASWQRYGKDSVRTREQFRERFLRER